MTRNLTKPQGLLPPMRLSGQANIAAALGAQILSGARKPGERMPTDGEMFETFGVSRVVTREVIKTLAAKGMVTSRAKTGTIVMAPSNWNWLDPDVLSWRVTLGFDLEFLRHITDVRRAVEPVAAGLAALNRTRTDIVKLRESLAVMAQTKDDRGKFAEADLGFHLAVSTASRNPFFQTFAGTIKTALSSMLAVNAIADSPKMHYHTVATHTAVVDAIEAGDEEAAVKAMLRTVDDGFSHAKRAHTKQALGLSALQDVTGAAPDKPQSRPGPVRAGKVAARKTKDAR